MKIGMMVCMDVRDSDLIDRYLAEDLDVLIHANAFVGSYVCVTDYVSKRLNCWNISASRNSVEGPYSYKGVYYVAAPNGAIIAGKTGQGGSGYAYYDMGIR